MEVTIRDVARLAGVSITTVSRALNKSGPVSEDARIKVYKVAQECGYVPNNSARNLKIRRLKTIAVIAKQIANPFFQKMIPTIERNAALRGYSTLIQDVAPFENEMDVAIQEAKDRSLSGIILMGGTYTYSNDKFNRLGIPCVLLTVSGETNVDKSLYSSVTVDDIGEAMAATEYLIGLGHRRIGFINHSYAEEKNTPNDLRYIGYVKALEKHGIPYDPNLVTIHADLRESGYKIGFDMMKYLLAHNHDISAVFTFADLLAVGAAKAVFVMGYKVPDDISIVGFDGVEATEFHHPSIDTVMQPAEQMAQSGADALFGMISGEPSRHMVYPCTLLKRGSCREWQE